MLSAATLPDMKIQSDALVKFVHDFDLQRSNGVICFDAVILYTTLNKQVQVPSEVHIIHLNHTALDVVYLLEPDLPKLGIPDKLDDVRSIQYRSNEFLYIKGSSPTDGKFLLSIHPVASSCEPYTLQELFAKTYN